MILKYTPKKNKKGSLVSLVLTLLGGAGLVFSVTAELESALYVQLISLFLFVLGFEFLYRYEMTTFVYILDEKDFVIIKEVGKKKTCVCNLSMRTALSIHPTSKRKKDKKSLEKTYGRTEIRYNHTQAMCSKQKYSILFSFNDKVAEIIFEPSEQMVSAIQKRIAENEDIDFVFD